MQVEDDGCTPPANSQAQSCRTSRHGIFGYSRTAPSHGHLNVVERWSLSGTTGARCRDVQEGKGCSHHGLESSFHASFRVETRVRRRPQISIGRTPLVKLTARAVSVSELSAALRRSRFRGRTQVVDDQQKRQGRALHPVRAPAFPWSRWTVGSSRAFIQTWPGILDNPRCANAKLKADGAGPSAERRPRPAWSGIDRGARAAKEPGALSGGQLGRGGSSGGADEPTGSAKPSAPYVQEAGHGPETRSQSRTLVPPAGHDQVPSDKPAGTGRQSDTARRRPAGAARP